MHRPYCNLKIGDEEFNFVTEGSVTSGWRLFTDTARLLIAKKFFREGRNIYIGEDNVFQKGDYVEFKAGYFPNQDLIFQGYLKKIKPNLPIEMEFEDSMYLLKQTNLTLSYKSVTLEKLLNDAISQSINESSGYIKEGLERVELNLVDSDLGAFRVTNKSLVNILEELKKTYILTSFFRGNTLHVGLPYGQIGAEHRLRFGVNIIDEGTDLEYLRADDVSFKVKATSLLPNNKKIEVEVGDPNGETRQIFKYNATKSDLTEWAEREIERLRFEGFRGKLKTFFDPVIKHGDTVVIVDPFNQDRSEGTYLVEAVQYDFGVNGYFQILTLGQRVDVNG